MISGPLWLLLLLALIGAVINPFAAPHLSEAVYWGIFLLVGGLFWYRWFRQNRID